MDDKTLQTTVDSIYPITLTCKTGAYTRIRIKVTEYGNINLIDSIHGNAEIDVGNSSF